MAQIDPRIAAYALDRGIDDITHAELPDRLPSDASRLAPAQIGHQAQLARILATPSLNDMLQAMLATDVDPQLLTPAGYRDALYRGANRLREAARKDPAAREALNAAADVMTSEIDLHELLAMYRRVLYQG